MAGQGRAVVRHVPACCINASPRDEPLRQSHEFNPTNVSRTTPIGHAVATGCRSPAGAVGAEPARLAARRRHRGARLAGRPLAVAGDRARGVLLALVVYFFRDPPRRIPDDCGSDRRAGRRHGRRSHAARRSTNSSAARPCGSASSCRSSTCTSTVRRSPAAVVEMHYQPGEFLNAMRPESAERNEFDVDRLRDARTRRRAGSPCGRFPACWPGESSARCGPDRRSHAARSLV